MVRRSAPCPLARDAVAVAIAAGAAVAVAIAASLPAGALEPADNGPAIAIARAAGEIVVDGAPGDPGWEGVPPIETWWETNPGDSIPPPAGLESVAWMTYDDEFLYAFFDFRDPSPRAVASQLGDHDQIGGGPISDYGGIILDPRGDGKVAQMFLANAAGVQYDAISSDASGEDSSPDFFWQSAARVTETGWQLEMRIPFSSIRYGDPDPDHWGILLYRNRPRDFRYQYFTSKLPRDRNCFICSVRELRGLEGLSTGDRWVVAPYVSASRLERATAGPGTTLESDGEDYDGGVDAKWIPNPDTVVDLTLRPDFSQIESDTVQITANERFALFNAERRPFFLESVDLFSTPLQAVYTRTFTDPDWGARATGGGEKTRYTVLAGRDRGGGLVVLPGSNASGFAEQDFESTVALGRVRREIGRSFVSAMYAGREIQGGGHNRVVGPDFEWRPNDRGRLVGQLLYSDSRTPDRPDLAAEWDGRSLSGHAAHVQWSFGDGTWDHYVRYRDVHDAFRADNGFIPQVGIRSGYGEGGRTWYFDDGPVRRLRAFAYSTYTEDRDGNLLERGVVPGIGFDALLNSFVRVEFAQEDLRATQGVFRRRQVRPTVQLRPGKVFAYLSLSGAFGDEIDFANDRLGDGSTVNLSAEIRPGRHLRLAPLYGRRTLDVDAGPGLSGRLLTAEIARLEATWTFSARSWLRLIGQWSATERDPALWTFPVEPESEDAAGSLVFAYKLNWQTVLYVGYADARGLDPDGDLRPSDRQSFFKLSYAFRG